MLSQEVMDELDAFVNKLLEAEEVGVDLSGDPFGPLTEEFFDTIASKFDAMFSDGQKAPVEKSPIAWFASPVRGHPAQYVVDKVAKSLVDKGTTLEVDWRTVVDEFHSLYDNVPELNVNPEAWGFVGNVLAKMRELLGD